MLLCFPDPTASGKASQLHQSEPFSLTPALTLSKLANDCHSQPAAKLIPLWEELALIPVREEHGVYPHAGRAWLSFSLSFSGKSWAHMTLFRIDWVHLGTLGTRGGELAAAQPYALDRLRGLWRWSCNLGICDGVACCRDILECSACAE
jgi:hypothetical protein